MNTTLNNISKNIDKLLVNSEIVNSSILIFKPIQAFDNTNIETLFIRNDLILFVHKLFNYSNFEEYIMIDAFKTVVDIKLTEYYKLKCMYIDVEALDNFKNSFYTYINDTIEKYNENYNQMCLT